LITKKQQIKDVSVFYIEKENIDAACYDDLKAELTDGICDLQFVIFDLSRVKLMDSSGIGILLTCQRFLQSKGGRLCICGVGEHLKVLLTLVNLDRIVKIFETTSEAIEAFSTHEK
jgi:anti-anti-sigma factor